MALHQQNVNTSEGSVRADGMNQTSTDDAEVLSLDSLSQSLTEADRQTDTADCVRRIYA